MHTLTLLPRLTLTSVHIVGRMLDWVCAQLSSVAYNLVIHITSHVVQAHDNCIAVLPGKALISMTMQQCSAETACLLGACAQAIMKACLTHPLGAWFRLSLLMGKGLLHVLLAREQRKCMSLLWLV
jgi:hypothetical protein